MNKGWLAAAPYRCRPIVVLAGISWFSLDAYSEVRRTISKMLLYI